ncbi:MAG: glycosyltransferase family 39 protein [Planctomycetaceae bacterium]
MACPGDRALQNSVTQGNLDQQAFRRSRSLIVGIALIGCAFLGWRGPTMLRFAGLQDEDCYAIPGLTILENGRPQLPHLPSRNLDSPYYRSDEAAYLEPPLYFYVQALFYSILPDIYGTARLISAIAGIVILFSMARLAVLCDMTVPAALWGAGLFMMSRWFYFNATQARPDTLCSAFGLLTILATEAWIRTRHRKWLITAGALIGFGGLTHPFALVYAVQMAGWTALTERGWQRLFVPATLAVVAIFVACLWLPLILFLPDVFAIQFQNQFLHSRGGSIFVRSLWPWQSIAFHVGFLWPHINPWQFCLALLGPVFCIWHGQREHNALLKTVGWLSISGAFLLCILVGAHHPVFGYFSYPSALAFIGVGYAIDHMLSWISTKFRFGRVMAYTLAVCLVVSMLMGSGIRVTAAYLQNWNNVSFNGPRFAHDLLRLLPEDATYLVDEEFTLDFIRDGRKTIAFRAIIEGSLPESTPYDYRIEGRSTDRYFRGRNWDDTLEWTVGEPSEPHGIYARIHRRHQ